MGAVAACVLPRALLSAVCTLPHRSTLPAAHVGKGALCSLLPAGNPEIWQCDGLRKLTHLQALHWRRTALSSHCRPGHLTGHHLLMRGGVELPAHGIYNAPNSVVRAALLLPLLLAAGVYRDITAHFMGQRLRLQGGPEKLAGSPVAGEQQAPGVKSEPADMKGHGFSLYTSCTLAVKASQKPEGVSLLLTYGCSTAILASLIEYLRK